VVPRVAEFVALCQGSPMDMRIAYSGCTLDRATHLRADAFWLAERLRAPSTRIVPVWRNRSLIAAGNRPRLLALTEGLAEATISLAHEVVFLGLDEDGSAWFACDLSHQGEEQLPAIGDEAGFQDLGRAVTALAADEAALLAYARALAYWHRRHRFCGVCGSSTMARHGGHMRLCTDPACEAQHFPRTDPVVIMLVTRSHGGSSECLLARQRHWMPGLVSALAGFVEPGETLEEAVRREVREEAGLDVEAIHYRASQPWPFPSSLMLGFRAETRNGAELRIDGDELEDARWFGRTEVAEIRSLGLRLPFRGTIARALIEAWLVGDEAGHG
jgi:NAD+ diphosphatase